MAGFTVGGDRVDSRAWITFDGTGTVSIDDDYQVASLTDHAVGAYGFTTDFTFTNTSYTVVTGYQGTKDSGGIWGGLVDGSHTTSHVRIRMIDSVGNFWDCNRIMASVFGN